MGAWGGENGEEEGDAESERMRGARDKKEEGDGMGVSAGVLRDRWRVITVRQRGGCVRMIAPDEWARSEVSRRMWNMRCGPKTRSGKLNSAVVKRATSKRGSITCLLDVGGYLPR